MNIVIELDETRRRSAVSRKLSNLQVHVIEYLIEGKTTEQISKEIGLSEYTIDVIIDSVRKKFEAKTLPEAISRYLAEH